MARVFPLNMWWPKRCGIKSSGLGAPDESHRCLFMIDSDRWGSKQTLQWRETIPDSPSVPWKEEVASLRGARGRKRRRIVSLES